MALNIIYPGDIGNIDKLMENWNDLISLNILNKIRNTIDRASIDNNDDIFSEAYIDTTGQNNTVNTGSCTATFDTDKYKYNVDTSIIVHDIPSGTFNNTSNTLIGKALIEDWENGISIQHRLENATEDSGWIEDGVIGEFTAFTSEPTKYIVKLIPKNTSPTAGYPSIKGSGVSVE